MSAWHAFDYTDCSSWTKRHQFLLVTSNNTPWNIIFAYGIWQLWLSCKKRIFNPPSDTRNQMLHRTLHLSLEYFLLIHPRKSSIPKCILNISWQPPVDPFVTLNIDGSTFRQSRICWRWGSDKRLSREMNHWISPSHRFNNQQYS